MQQICNSRVIEIWLLFIIVEPLACSKRILLDAKLRQRDLEFAERDLEIAQRDLEFQPT